MKTGKKYKQGKNTLIVCILLVVVIIAAGFFVLKYISNLDSFADKTELNHVQMLSTEQVIQLLGDNGIKLEKNSSFNVDSYVTNISGDIVKPTAYTANDGMQDVDIIIYELKEYVTFNSAAVGVDSNILNKLLITDRAVYGKNVIVWPLYPVSQSLVEDEDYLNTAFKFLNSIFDILYESAFNGKDVEYAGDTESWSAIADVRQFKNVYSEGSSRDSISEYVSGKLYLKYNGENINCTGVESIIFNGVEVNADELMPFVKSSEHQGYYMESSVINYRAFENDADFYEMEIRDESGTHKLTLKQK